MSIPRGVYIRPVQLTDDNGIQVEGVNPVATYIWDSIGLAWVKATSSGGGGGGGTQYAEGTTIATATGTVALAKNSSNVTRALSLDGSGNLNVNLAAGSISGGNAAASPTGAAVPASAGYTGFNSGGNLVGVSSGNPLPVSAVQSGAWTVTQSGAWSTGRTWTLSSGTDSIAVTGTFFQATQPISAVALPLPTGAATEATLAALSAKFAALGQGLMAASVPVVIASNQSAVPVSGPLTDTQLRASAVPVTLTSTTITGSVAVTGPLTDTQLRASAVPVSLTSTTISGTVAATQSGVWSVGRTWALSSGTDSIAVAGTVAVSGTVATQANRPSGNTRSSVAGAAADTLILAANASRLGATISNDSSAILYLCLGTAAASTTDYTVKMVQDAYYEVPFGYTGQIRGIWASATGFARVGELT